MLVYCDGRRRRDADVCDYRVRKVDDYLASDGKGTDVWAPAAQWGLLRSEVYGDDHADLQHRRHDQPRGQRRQRRHRVRQGHGGERAVRGRAPTTSPRTTSTRCAPRRCSPRVSSRASARRCDVVSDAIAAITTHAGATPRSRTEDRRGRGGPQILRQVLFLRGRSNRARSPCRCARPPPPAPARVGPSSPPRCPPSPPPSRRPAPHSQIEIDCEGPVTTWVDGLADTTVGGAGGRPIGFGIDKELKFPKGRRTSPPSRWRRARRSTTTAPTATARSSTARRRPRPWRRRSRWRCRHSATTSLSARGLRAAAVPGLGDQPDGHHRCAPPSTRRRNPRARSPPAHPPALSPQTSSPAPATKARPCARGSSPATSR